MISYLTLEQALRIARFASDGTHSDLFTEGAALLHSVARFDGNKRLAWLATYVFLAKNGVDLDPDDDAAYALVIAVASGEIDDVAAIATALRAFATD